jgi:hypothetical protein
MNTIHDESRYESGKNHSLIFRGEKFFEECRDDSISEFRNPERWRERVIVNGKIG